MKNYVKDGDTLEFTAPTGGVVSGEGYVTGSAFGVAMVSAAQTEKYSARVMGVVSLAKDTSVFAEGAAVFWDDSAKECSVSASGLWPIGYAAKGALTGDTTVEVKLSSQSMVAVP